MSLGGPRVPVPPDKRSFLTSSCITIALNPSSSEAGGSHPIVLMRAPREAPPLTRHPGPPNTSELSVCPAPAGGPWPCRVWREPRSLDTDVSSQSACVFSANTALIPGAAAAAAAAAPSPGLSLSLSLSLCLFFDILFDSIFVEFSCKPRS